jgi:hypothetical protein
MKTFKGTCHCGCGQETNRDPKGLPRRHIRGHNRRGTGEGWIEQGYRFIQRDGKKRALHRVIVEEREGRRLRSDEIVHHQDHNPLNNDPRNLVILSRSEHQRLHARKNKAGRNTPEEEERAISLYEPT